MRILILANADAIVVKEYIEYVLAPNSENEIILLCDMKESEIKPHCLALYKKANVHLEPLRTGILKLVYQLPGVRSRLGSQIWCRRIKKKYGHFDVVHVHGVDVNRAEIAIGLRDNTEKLILTIWGSEFLRSSDKMKEKYRRYYDRADWITFTSEGVCRKFKEYYGGRYQSHMKVTHVAFGIFDYIDHALMSQTRAEIRQHWKIGTDGSIMVFVAHNGSPAQRHIEITRELEHLSEDVKGRITLLYTMTYGVKDPGYLKELKKAAESTGCRYVILTDYLNEEKMAELRTICDILIHAQTTDAYSGSVMETLYAGGIVLNGRWLRYEDIPDCDKRMVEFDTIEEIPEKLTEVVNNIVYYKHRFPDNSKVMRSINGREETTREWLALLGEA